MDELTQPVVEEAALASTPPRPRRGLGKGGVALVVVAVLAVLVVAWWYTQPRSYRMVGRYKTYTVTLVPTRAGFLTQENATTFVLRDWKTGAVVWRHTASMSSTGGVVGSVDTTPPPWSIAGTGRTFAAVSRQPVGTRVQSWEGKTATCDRIFPDLKGDPGVRALEDGRVVAWSVAKGISTAVVLQGDTVLARGALLPVSEAGSLSVSPDGVLVGAQLATGSFTYATLAVQEGKIALGPTQRIGDMVDTSLYPPYYVTMGLLQQGHFVTEMGEIYGPKGALPAKDWIIDTITPGGEWVVQERNGRTRAFNPISGDQWSVNIRGDNGGGDVTANGRYLLAHLVPQPSEATQRANELLRQIPGLGEQVPESTSSCVALYERPGRLRAVLRLDTDGWWPNAEPFEWWWFPSPDGRAFVTNAVLGYDEERAECLLFRW